MCLCIIYLPNLLVFVDLQLSEMIKNDTTNFSSPNLRKHIYTKKGFNTLPLTKDLSQIFCFTIHQRSKIKGILDFSLHIFILPVVSTSK